MLGPNQGDSRFALIWPVYFSFFKAHVFDLSLLLRSHACRKVSDILPLRSQSVAPTAKFDGA